MSIDGGNESVYLPPKPPTDLSLEAFEGRVLSHVGRVLVHLNSGKIRRRRRVVELHLIPIVATTPPPDDIIRHPKIRVACVIVCPSHAMFEYRASNSTIRAV